MEYSIKKTAEITGLSEDTLRYYDRQKILSPKRKSNGYRIYDEEDIKKLKIIVIMKYALFTLPQIETMLQLLEREPSPACQREGIHLLQEKSSELEEYIRNYLSIITLIQNFNTLLRDFNISTQTQSGVDEHITNIFNDIRNKEPLYNLKRSK